METGIAILETKAKFVLPKKDVDNLKVFRFLTKQRGLPCKLVDDLIERGMIYQDIRMNCVFPCFDENGEPKGAIIKSILPDVPARRKHKSSDYSFGWSLKPNGGSNLVLVTENPIEAMSIIALNPDLPLMGQFILSSNGPQIESLRRFLWSYPQIRKIVLALRKRQTNKIVQIIKTEYGKNYRIAKYLPQSRGDWNDQLLATVQGRV